MKNRVPRLLRWFGRDQTWSAVLARNLVSCLAAIASLGGPSGTPSHAQEFVPPQRPGAAVVPASNSSPAGTGIELSYPQPSPALPIRVQAESAVRWRQGGMDQWVLQGGPQIQQGDWTARGDWMVIWVDRDPAAAANRLIVYLEGNAEVAWPRPADPAQAGAPTLNRIVDQHWVGRLWTTSEMQIEPTRTAEGTANEFAELRQRADQARQQGIPYAAQPVALQENLPPPAPGGVLIQQPATESFTISPQTGQLLPPTNAPPLPRSSPPPPLNGVQMFTTRVELFPRQPSVPLNARSFRGDLPNETITVISGGVRVVIDSQELAAMPELAGESSRLVNILADSAIWWRTAADPATGGVERNEIYLEGDVIFNMGRRTVYADRMYYDATFNRGTILDAEFLTPLPSYQGLVRLKADVLQQLDENSFQAHGAAVTGSRIGVPRYWLQSDQINLDGVQNYAVDEETGAMTVDPYTGEPILESRYFVESQGNRVYVGNVPLFYWPRIRTSLDEPNFYLRSISFGNDRIFGAQVRTRWDLHQLFGIRRKPPNTSWLGDVDYLSDRGLGLGSEYTYRWSSFLGIPGNVEGIYRSWFIRDSGLDNLGRDRRTDAPESENRGMWFLNHRHQFTRDFELKAELGYVRTRNFLEQYFQQEWDWNKDYTTGFLFERRFGNQALDLWSEVRVNDFFTQTNWLPRLDHFILGQPLGNSGLIYHSHSHVGYANFEPLDPPESPEDLAKFTPLAWEVAEANGVRAGTRQQIEYPFQLGPLRLVPYLLGDATFWEEDLNNNDLFRTYGQAGIRASLPFWRVDPTVHSTLFNVNGLAHKVTWENEVAYAGASDNFDNLPLYDSLDDDAQEFFRRRMIFDTFGLTFGDFVPTEFDERQFARRYGMQSYVTSPSAEIADELLFVRTGFHNRWQTKRGLPGRESIIDWITFDVDATVFPNADRDNFGESVGLVNYDFRWFLGDRVSLLSDGFFDFFSQGLKTVSFGAQWHRPLLGDLYLGLRTIEGPLSSNVLTGRWTYHMSDKWGLRANSTYDFGSTGNIGQQVAAVYIGESFMWQLGVNYDVSRDNVGLVFGLEPRILTRPQIFRPGFASIPPPSANYVE